MLRKHARKGLDETDEVVGLLLRWSEATGAVVGDDELVTMDAAAITVLADKRGIAKPVTSVQCVTGVKEGFLNAYPVEVVLICEVVGTHGVQIVIVIVTFPCHGHGDLG